MSNKNMTFYWGSGSPPCWKAMICLAEKGLWENLNQSQLSFSDKEHKSEKVLKINQRGQMPTFKDAEHIINESSAICLYLEDNYTSDANRLLPKDPAKKALVYQRMFEIENLQSKVSMPIVYYKFKTDKDKQDAGYLKEKAEEAAKEMQVWDKYLAGTKYIAGDSFTMADVFFFPMLGFFVRNKMSFPNSPNLQRYYDELKERPSIKTTTPPHWKDSDSPAMLAEVKA